MASPDELSLQAQKKYVPHHSLFRGGTERERERECGFLGHIFTTESIQIGNDSSNNTRQTMKIYGFSRIADVRAIACE